MKLTEKPTTGTSVIEVPVIDVNGAARVTRLDALAIEEPLEIRIKRRDETRSVSVTMRTPGNDAELAVGFLFGEGLIDGPHDLISVKSKTRAECGKQNIVIVEVPEHVGIETATLDRNFYTTSSCGVCGKASIEALEVYPDIEISTDLEVDSDVIHDLPGRLASVQVVFRETGGLHAAALFDGHGGLVDVKEDVGRHNAMDKLVGTRVMAGETPLDDKIVLVSGRASFELVQKAVMAGIPMMAAVGAPSSLAVELAARFGMTLVGFVRDGRFNVYTKPERVNLKPSLPE